MSVATTEATRSARYLIDSRLDTIDRMLLGRVSRPERLEIVREVEAQIFEQLRERGADESSREDVLAVLGRLDPPEAYLPEADESSGPVRSRASSMPRAAHGRPVHARDSRVAKVSGIVGLVALTLFLSVPATYMMAVKVSSAILLFTLGGPAFVLSLVASSVAMTLAACARLGNVWAVVGLVTGIVSAVGLVGLTCVTLALGGL